VADKLLAANLPIDYLFISVEFVRANPYKRGAARHRGKDKGGPGLRGWLPAKPGQERQHFMEETKPDAVQFIAQLIYIRRWIQGFRLPWVLP
jgi:hypothetical protein